MNYRKVTIATYIFDCVFLCNDKCARRAPPQNRFILCRIALTDTIPIPAK